MSLWAQTLSSCRGLDGIGADRLTAACEPSFAFAGHPADNHGSRRGVAQPGSAPALGAGCRRFESSRPDHKHQGVLRSHPKHQPSFWMAFFISRAAVVEWSHPPSLCLPVAHSRSSLFRHQRHQRHQRRGFRKRQPQSLLTPDATVLAAGTPACLACQIHSSRYAKHGWNAALRADKRGNIQHSPLYFRLRKPG